MPLNFAIGFECRTSHTCTDPSWLETANLSDAWFHATEKLASFETIKGDVRCLPLCWFALCTFIYRPSFESIHNFQNRKHWKAAHGYHLRLLPFSHHLDSQMLCGKKKGWIKIEKIKWLFYNYSLLIWNPKYQPNLIRAH